MELILVFRQFLWVNSSILFKIVNQYFNIILEICVLKGKFKCEIHYKEQFIFVMGNKLKFVGSRKKISYIKQK